MTSRVCLEPGCPRIQREPRCTQHRRARDQERGTRQQRGYDTAYDQQRAAVAPDVAAGLVECWSCEQPIKPGQPWDLGHCEGDRSIIHGPQHRGENRGWRGPCPHPTHKAAT